MVPAMLKSVMLFDMPGGMEWILIVLAVLILFGGRKIPEFMRGLGKGIREFNDAKTNVKNEIEEGMRENPAASSTSSTVGKTEQEQLH